MSWIWLAISSYLIWAFVNLIDKILVSKYVKDPLILNLIDTFFGTLLVVLYIILFKQISLLPWMILSIVLISGVIRFVSYWLYYKGMQNEEASRVTMLMQLSPVFTLILAYFIVGERLGHLQIIAFILLLLGGIIASLHHEEKKLKISPVFWIMLLSSFGISLSVVLLKFGFKINDFWTIMLWAMVGEMIAIIVLSITAKKNLFSSFNKLNITAKITLLVGVVASSLAFILNSKALETGPASVISVLSVTNPLFVFILAIIASVFIPKIIKENINFKTVLLKVLALIFIFSGLVLLSK